MSDLAATKDDVSVLCSTGGAHRMYVRVRQLLSLLYVENQQPSAWHRLRPTRTYVWGFKFSFLKGTRKTRDKTVIAVRTRTSQPAITRRSLWQPCWQWCKSLIMRRRRKKPKKFLCIKIMGRYQQQQQQHCTVFIINMIFCLWFYQNNNNSQNHPSVWEDNEYLYSICIKIPST